MFSKKILILAGAGTAVVILFGAIFTYVATSGDGPKEDIQFALALLDDDRMVAIIRPVEPHDCAGKRRRC